MTSEVSAEAASTIICTSKQTRFHVDAPNYRELDIEQLCIAVVPPTTAASTTGSKAKARAPRSVELLSGSTLRLKQGRRYALVGRNGSGKSTLLRAIAEKLIPGIPEEMRIAILQQTRLTDNHHDNGTNKGLAADGLSDCSVLQHVMDAATARDRVLQEIQVLSEGLDDGTDAAAVRALRAVKHQRLQDRLFLLDKQARLRSGARGLQARKALGAFEKVVAESSNALQETDDASASAATLESETQEATDMLAALQLEVEPHRLALTETRASSILAGLGFFRERMARPISSMSGGWHMRASLAAVLLREADVLILDEPTNFLDLLGIIWLQRFLCALDTTESQSNSPTLIVVSHDRDFVASPCTDLLVLKDRQLTSFHGDLRSFEAAQAERKLWLASMREAQDRQRAHMEKTIRQNIKAGKAADDENKLRQAKSRQKKLDNRLGLQVNVRGGRFKLNRDLAGWHDKARSEIEVPPDARPVVIALPPPPDLRFPGPLLSLDDVSFLWPNDNGAPATDKSAMVVRNANLSIAMGDRVGILGLNGAGKSTLARLLASDARPTSGTMTTHPRLRMGYYSQHAVEALQALCQTPEDSALTALSLLQRDAAAANAISDEDYYPGQEGPLRALLADVGLQGRVASDVPLARLSGGQLVRCALARLFRCRPHVLVLDEVTTHLDYESVTALRVALASWEGAVVLVSHDRWVLRGVVEGAAGHDDDGCDDDDGGGVGGHDAGGGNGGVGRRRVVLRFWGGCLSVLGGGVDEFERIMEKKAAKLLA